MKPITNNEVNYYIDRIYDEYPFLKKLGINYLTTVQNNEVLAFVSYPKEDDMFRQLIILWPRYTDLDSCYHKPTRLYPIKIKRTVYNEIIESPKVDIKNKPIVLHSESLESILNSYYTNHDVLVCLGPVE